MSQYNPVTPTIQGQAMIAESLGTKEGLVFTKVEWARMSKLWFSFSI